ncbi:MAG: DUF3526 domain-containing protein [Bacteroidota bacterium]
MIRSLIRLDIALLYRSRAFWILLLFLTMGAVFALVSGLDWRKRYIGAAQADRVQVAKDRALLVQVYDDLEAGIQTPSDVDSFDGNGEFIPDPRDPYVAGFYHTQLAELPVSPLLGLATGSTELRATHHLIRSVPIAELFRIGEPAERVNPGALAAGRFDLLAFIIYLCPLVLVVLLFDAVARELESNGQAALLAGLGSTQRELLLARGITRGSVILIIALTASIVGLAFLGQLLSMAALAWLFGVTLYLLFWTTLLLGVASLRFGVVGSAAISVALWVVLLLVSPGLVERVLRPSGLLEPRVLADAKVRRVIREASADKDASAAAKTRVARDYWQIDFASVPACADREGVLSEYVLRRLSDETYAKAMHTGRLREVLYDRHLDHWGWLSPVLYFGRAMETIAGVGPERQRVFEEQVFSFHTQWRDRVTDAIFACHQFTRDDFENAPQFIWHEPKNGFTPYLTIIFLSTLALLLGRFALRRHPLFK